MLSFLMKLKHWLWAITLVAGLLVNSCAENDVNSSVKQQPEPELVDLIPTLTRDSLLSLLKDKHYTTEQYNYYLDLINQNPNTDTLTIDMDRIKNWPIGTMRKLTKNLSLLLGTNFSDSLFSVYNPELYTMLTSDSLGYEKIRSVPYRDVSTDIKVPAVYPELADFFVPSLEDFLVAHPEIAEQVWDDTEVIILTRDENWKYVIWYYEDGYIRLAQYSSPWTSRRKTPQWTYYTNLNKDLERCLPDGRTYFDRGDRPDSTKRSHKYQSAPMPYAVPIAKNTNQTGIYFHQGVVNGNALSHGCMRVPWHIAVELYDRIGMRQVKVITTDLYGPRK